MNKKVAEDTNEGYDETGLPYSNKPLSKKEKEQIDRLYILAWKVTLGLIFLVPIVYLVEPKRVLAAVNSSFLEKCLEKCLKRGMPVQKKGEPVTMSLLRSQKQYLDKVESFLLKLRKVNLENFQKNYDKSELCKYLLECNKKRVDTIWNSLDTKTRISKNFLVPEDIKWVENRVSFLREKEFIDILATTDQNKFATWFVQKVSSMIEDSALNQPL